MRILPFLIAISIAGCTPVAEAPPASRTGQGLKIATWNMEHLAEGDGDGCRPRVEADYAEMRRHVAALDADVIAIEEVENKAAAERVFDPKRYDVVMSSRPASGRGGECRGLPGQTIRQQAVGFAIRKGVKWTRHADLKALGLGNPDLRWGVDVSVGAVRPVRLLAVHLKSGCNIGRDPGDADCNVLFLQEPVLEEWIDARARAGEAFAVLGDWNRRMDAAGDAFLAALDDGKPAGAKLTSASGGRGATCKARYREYIDFIMLGEAAAARVVPGSFEEYGYDGPEAGDPSDHCPVAVRVG